MTTTWIVGLDGSDGSAAALRWAVARAAERGDRVRPVAAWHVPLPIKLMAGRRSIDVDRAGIKAAAEFHAGEVIDRVEHATVVDEVAVLEGHPAQVLCEMAGPATPLVVGRQGVVELKHRLLGSVSQYVATHADGPVVVVPDERDHTPLRRIVVGFDGSDHSAEALRWALSIAPDTADIELLIAIDVIPWLSPELVEERHSDAVTSARKRIGAKADEVDPEHRATRNFVLHGPRQAMAETLGDADLVVVGPRGIGGLARAVLGSVTTWLLHEAQCPIAVVPSAD